MNQFTENVQFFICLRFDDPGTDGLDIEAYNLSDSGLLCKGTGNFPLSSGATKSLSIGGLVYDNRVV